MDFSSRRTARTAGRRSTHLVVAQSIRTTLASCARQDRPVFAFELDSVQSHLRVAPAHSRKKTTQPRPDCTPCQDQAFRLSLGAAKAAAVRYIRFVVGLLSTVPAWNTTESSRIGSGCQRFGPRKSPDQEVFSPAGGRQSPLPFGRVRAFVGLMTRSEAIWHEIPPCHPWKRGLSSRFTTTRGWPRCFFRRRLATRFDVFGKTPG